MRFPRLGTIAVVAAAYALPTMQIVAWKWLAVMPFASILLFLGCYGLVVLWAYLASGTRRGETATARETPAPQLLGS